MCIHEFVGREGCSLSPESLRPTPPENSSTDFLHRWLTFRFIFYLLTFPSTIGFITFSLHWVCFKGTSIPKGMAMLVLYVYKVSRYQNKINLYDIGLYRCRPSWKMVTVVWVTLTANWRPVAYSSGSNITTKMVEMLGRPDRVLSVGEFCRLCSFHFIFVMINGANP